MLIFKPSTLGARFTNSLYIEISLGGFICFAFQNQVANGVN
jgi:hypothetical protein